MLLLLPLLDIPTACMLTLRFASCFVICMHDANDNFALIETRIALTDNSDSSIPLTKPLPMYMRSGGKSPEHAASSAMAMNPAHIYSVGGDNQVNYAVDEDELLRKAQLKAALFGSNGPEPGDNRSSMTPSNSGTIFHSISTSQLTSTCVSLQLCSCSFH